MKSSQIHHIIIFIISVFGGCTNTIQTESASIAPKFTITVCSFNIKFLSHYKKRDNASIASILSNIDIVIIQELTSPPHDGHYPDGQKYYADPEATSFVHEMKQFGFNYVISPEDSGPVKQNHTAKPETQWAIAFYKPKIIQIPNALSSGYIATDLTDNINFRRVPYAFPFNVINRNDFIIISVHLTSGVNNHIKRKHEIDTVITWINKHNKTEKDFIIAGDMNIENNKELTLFLPSNYISLNNHCLATNTTPLRPRPYDHVIFNPAKTNEVQQYFEVMDLVEIMERHWDHSKGVYPGNPYNHNLFSQFFSDHNPIIFKVNISHDDD